MAKVTAKNIVGIAPSTLGMVQGVFSSLIGLTVAIFSSLESTVQFTSDTGSVLAGLTLGVAKGFVAVIVLPLIYFGVGWLIGWLQGVILNYVLSNSGGLRVKIEE